jgi:hypothetical protein
MYASSAIAFTAGGAGETVSAAVAAPIIVVSEATAIKPRRVSEVYVIRFSNSWLLL